MSATGFCHCCEIPTQLTSTESPTCLKCQSSFVEVYDLAPAACLPDVKQPRLNNANTDQPDSDADITCSICLGEWTSGGEHRLVSLKCGHLFGESCIAKWLQAKASVLSANRRMGSTTSGAFLSEASRQWTLWVWLGRLWSLTWLTCVCCL